MALDALPVGLRRELAALDERGFNFDRSQVDLDSPPDGWNVDHRCQPLPPEPPGPPVPGGSWEIAQRLMRGYEFADPGLVRAYYDPGVPLEERTMLLEIRFLGLRFHVGTRVTDVRDETREIEGRQVRAWGWSYATLDGHIEMGEMAWEVRKWLDTGAVDFTLSAYSRQGQIPNPIKRLGFRIFARRQQLRFMRITCERMLRLTEAALGKGPTGEAVREAAERATTRPAPDAEAAAVQLARDVERDPP